MGLSLSATNYKFRVGYYDERRFVKSIMRDKIFSTYYATLVRNTDLPKASFDNTTSFNQERIIP